MNKKEEILLMDALLKDISGNWADEIISRLTEIIRIATKYNFEEIAKKASSVLEAEKSQNNRNFEGRVFETRYESGGYEGLSKFYEDFDFKLIGRSKEFLEKIDKLMTNEWLIFPDFKEFIRLQD
ncbi:hypothetical protein AAGG74_15305 [Bacillus mexicanus]|uniref:hypothetical protein n=1 Tax=Bacillus mexicanus TaxID=2834415 RepID=UPI003D257382